MAYRGKVELAHERKIRERNTTVYRFCHWPIWIWVFFLAPGPLTFSLFAHGFNRWNALWLGAVLIPLYRRVCYTFAWSAVITFATLNLAGLVGSAVTGVWYMHQLYEYAYFPLCAVVLFLGLIGKLPRVGPSTRTPG